MSSSSFLNLRLSKECKKCPTGWEQKSIQQWVLSATVAGGKAVVVEQEPGLFLWFAPLVLLQHVCCIIDDGGHIHGLFESIYGQVVS